MFNLHTNQKHFSVKNILPRCEKSAKLHKYSESKLARYWILKYGLRWQYAKIVVFFIKLIFLNTLFTVKFHWAKTVPWHKSAAKITNKLINENRNVNTKVKSNISTLAMRLLFKFLVNAQGSEVAWHFLFHIVIVATVLTDIIYLPSAFIHQIASAIFVKYNLLNFIQKFHILFWNRIKWSNTYTNQIIWQNCF